MPVPPRRHSLFRRAVLTLAVLIALALGADSLLWWIVGRRIEAAVATWVQKKRAQGFAISHGAERLIGWPSAATVELADFSLANARPPERAEVRWRAARLRLGVRLTAPRWLDVVPLGVEHVRLLGSPSVVLRAARLRAKVPLWPRRGSRTASIVGQDLRLGLAGFNPHLVVIAALRVTATRRSRDAGAGNAEAREVMKAEASGIDLAKGLTGGPGTRIDVVSADAALLGPPIEGASLPQSLAAWRNAGGTIALRDFSLVWGPLAIGGSGTFWLDPELQPAAEGRARIVGFAAALDALAARGTISESEATAAKAVMSLLARPSQEGGPPEVDVPLQLKNRTLSVARIPLLLLPRVGWTRAPAHPPPT